MSENYSTRSDRQRTRTYVTRVRVRGEFFDVPIEVRGTRVIDVCVIGEHHLSRKQRRDVENAARSAAAQYARQGGFVEDQSRNRGISEL